MAATERFRFDELDRAASDELLLRNNVGRVAYTFHDRVDVEPISYVYADGFVWGRTAPGTKLLMLQHNPFVAFEVDEVESAVDWRSVVVHGTVYFVSPEGGDRERDAYQAAVDHLRSVYPDVLNEDDVAPSRTVLFRIHVDSVTGRFASSTG